MKNADGPKALPYQIARTGWLAGVVAIIIIGVTARNSVRATGELIAFLFIGIGVLASVVSLGMVPKFGTRGLLGPAIAGVLINGLLLAIAIPNYLHARARTTDQGNPAEKRAVASSEQDRRAVAEESNRDEKTAGNWRRYRAAGLEIMSPFELKQVDTVASLQRAKKLMQLSPEQSAAAEENARRMEAYDGQGGGFAVNFNGRSLLPEEDASKETIVRQLTESLQQQFPRGFHSNSCVVRIAGQEATRLTLRYQVQARTARVENFIILGPSNLWQIQVFGPADALQYDRTVEKILGSVRFLPAEVKPSP